MKIKQPSTNENKNLFTPFTLKETVKACGIHSLTSGVIIFGT